MGGEYLPDCIAGETEIARIELESTLADVTSIRAKREGDCRVSTEAGIKSDNTDDAKDCQTLVFAGHEDHCAEMNFIGNFFDSAVAGW